MKPSKIRIKKGSVLPDFILGLSLSLAVIGGIFFFILHLWSLSFVNFEAYSIARSRLYQNNSNCKSAEALVSNNFIKRHYVCTMNGIHGHYKILEKLQTPQFSFDVWVK